MEKCKERHKAEAIQADVPTEAELERMSNQELLALYQETRAEEVKWALVLRMTGMVRSIASQVWGLYSNFAQLDDIVGEGVLVLLNAVEKFDPSKNAKFETYVSKRLRGMIVDLARRQDWLPRHVRRRAVQLHRAEDELATQLGRTPNRQEMSDYLGVTPMEYDEMRADASFSSVLSLEALLDSPGKSVCGSVSGGETCPPEEQYEEQELHEILKKGIASLREKEQLVLSLYYEKDLSMKEIAQILGVSAPRISQIHSRAIDHLREYMKQYMEL